MRNPRRTAASALSLVLLIAAWALPLTAQQAAVGSSAESGKLWMLRNYIVDECEPIPRSPVVFNYLTRKALAVREFLATSVDCGEVGRKGAREGWTYVFWTESEATAFGWLVEKARQKFGLTLLESRLVGQSWTERARAYEPFILIQLPGEKGPVRLWASGDGKLDVAISVASEGQFEIEAQVVTYDGKSCRGTRLLTEPTGEREREALPCRTSG